MKTKVKCIWPYDYYCHGVDTEAYKLPADIEETLHKEKDCPMHREITFKTPEEKIYHSLIKAPSFHDRLYHQKKTKSHDRPSITKAQVDPLKYKYNFVKFDDMLETLLSPKGRLNGKTGCDGSILVHNSHDFRDPPLPESNTPNPSLETFLKFNLLKDDPMLSCKRSMSRHKDLPGAKVRPVRDHQC